MSHLHLGRISSAVAMVGMSGGASAVTTNHPLLLATIARGATSAATAAATRGSPYFLGNGLTLGRNALVGGLALAGHRSFVSLPEGAQEVGKMVSNAADKMGLGDNQVHTPSKLFPSVRYE